MKRILITSLALVSINCIGQTRDQVLRCAQVVTTIEQAATRVGVPVELMLAVAWVESSCRVSLPPRLDGTTPSYGLFQIKLETAQWVDTVYKHKKSVTAAKLNNTYMNAFYASKFMKLLLKRYKGNQAMAIDAYNKGVAVSTQSTYVKRVQGAMR